MEKLSDVFQTGIWTNWSTRVMAQNLSFGQSGVHRVWRVFDMMKPSEALVPFKDPQLVQKTCS